jgi:hypothetical protein
MIRINQAILFLLALLLLSGCGNPKANHTGQFAVPLQGKKKEPGRLEFTKELHNFGTLKEGETVVFSFQFKNSGGSPFRLQKVELECSCLTVQYDKGEIEPGTISPLDVAFHTEGEWGNVIKTINIESTTGERKILTIGAFVENKNFNLDLNSSK